MKGLGLARTALAEFGLGVFLPRALVFNSPFLHPTLHMRLTNCVSPRYKLPILNAKAAAVVWIFACCAHRTRRFYRLSNAAALPWDLRPLPVKAMTRLACKHVNRAQAARYKPGPTYLLQEIICALRPDLSAPPPF